MTAAPVLDPVARKTAQSAPFRQVAEALAQPGADVCVSGVTGSLGAFLLTALQRGLERPILVVAADENSAESWRDDLMTIAGEGVVHYFPAWDVDLYDGRSPDADLAKQIEHAKDSNAKVEAGGGDSGRGVRDGRDAEAGTSKGPNVGTKDTTVTKETKVVEKAPTSRIDPTKPTGDSSFLDPNKVLSRIKSVYMSGLKRCHNNLLKKDPSAGGKVTLKFKIGPTGRVTKAKVSGFDSGVDACIQGLVLGWRFDVPKDSDGDPTDADFSLTLALQAT